MLLLGSAFAGAIAVFVVILRGFLWASIYFDLVEKHIVRPPGSRQANCSGGRMNAVSGSLRLEGGSEAPVSLWLTQRRPLSNGSSFGF